MKTLRRPRLPILALAIACLAAACGGGDEPLAGQSIPVESNGGIGDTPLGGVPFFGANDGACPSLTLANEADDRARMNQGADCFLREVEGGTPIVWDTNVPTTEGDPTFTRYQYDGDVIWVTYDNRADEFGSPVVLTERCAGVELANFGLLGLGCDRAAHPTGFAGFPEAELGG